MRFLVKIHIPVKEGNRAAKEGALGKTIQAILAEQKPEAVYFTEEEGMRTGYIFLQIEDAAEIPKISEPWFLAFNAGVEWHPVMLPEDLERAGPAIEEAVKKFG